MHSLIIYEVRHSRRHLKDTICAGAEDPMLAIGISYTHDPFSYSVNAFTYAIIKKIRRKNELLSTIGFPFYQIIIFSYVANCLFLNIFFNKKQHYAATSAIFNMLKGFLNCHGPRTTSTVVYRLFTSITGLPIFLRYSRPHACETNKYYPVFTSRSNSNPVDAMQRLAKIAVGHRWQLDALVNIHRPGALFR